MLTRKFTIRLLAAYLVILLGLGPAAHHAQFLGLHDHDSESGQSTPAACSCGQIHGMTAPANGESFSSAPENADHQCAFCSFFDQYQVIVFAWQNDQDPEILCSLFQLEQTHVASTVFFPHARGPPSLI